MPSGCIPCPNCGAANYLSDEECCLCGKQLKSSPVKPRERSYVPTAKPRRRSQNRSVEAAATTSPKD